jgi:dihydrofolate reductase
MRQQMRRFTRLTNGHSRKIDNHVHMVALYTTLYNFARINSGMSPGMACGLGQRLWGYWRHSEAGRGMGGADMRKLILKMSMSLDGFVAGPNGEADWMFRSQSDDSTDWIVETLWQAGLHAMGSRTYHDMAAYWPTSMTPFAAPMNDIPKVVFTRQKSFEPSSGADSWASARIANGSLAEEVRRLKQEPGKDILAHGGAGFARSLTQLGLIDEYRLLIHPVAIGTGLSLFSDLPRPIDLKLVSTSLFQSGVVGHVYLAETAVQP